MDNNHDCASIKIIYVAEDRYQSLLYINHVMRTSLIPRPMHRFRLHKRMHTASDEKLGAGPGNEANKSCMVVSWYTATVLYKTLHAPMQSMMPERLHEL